MLRTGPKAKAKRVEGRKENLKVSVGGRVCERGGLVAKRQRGKGRR